MLEIKIEGLETILERFEDIADTTPIEAALQKCCALVERSAKETAPKDTGALRNSIASRIESNNEEIKGVIYTPLEYAPYVEYGTGLFAEEGGRMDVPWNYQDDKGVWHRTNGQKPHPFMRPALADNREKIQRILKESVNNG